MQRYKGSDIKKAKFGTQAQHSGARSAPTTPPRPGANAGAKPFETLSVAVLVRAFLLSPGFREIKAGGHCNVPKAKEVGWSKSRNRLIVRLHWTQEDTNRSCTTLA